MTSSIKKRLQDQLNARSSASRAIASYILNNIPDLPFQTSQVVAQKLGISESTVGRFCRSLGYLHFKDLKKELKDDMGDSPWLIGDRLHAFQNGEGNDSASSSSLELEIASLVGAYELTRTEKWKSVVDRIATTPIVFVAGFGTERGIANSLVHMLGFLRDGAFGVDIASGHYGEVLLAEPKNVMLVIYEARRYSRQSMLLCQKAKEYSIPVTMITDKYCDWADQYTDEVFRVETDFNLIWDCTARMLTLTHLLVNDVSKKLGPQVESRLEKVSHLYSEFVGYT